MENIRMYSVMIASPSDVKKERNATEEVIRKYNSEVRFSKDKYRLETVRWELDVALGAADDAQDLINEDVTDVADFVVGIFFTKLGTVSNKGTSYTISELKRCLDAGKPVLVLFNNSNVPPDVNLDELKKLKNFKNNPQQYLGKKVLYAEYNGSENFKEVLRTEITKIINKNLVSNEKINVTSDKNSTITNLDTILQETDKLLSKRITNTSPQFILWKNIVENYIITLYSKNSEIWKTYSEISFTEGTCSRFTEENACYNGLETVKTLLLLLKNNI